MASKIYCRGTAKIKHKELNTVFEIESDELNWETVGGGERSMGPEFVYQAELDHEELGLLSWVICEYPVDAENYQSVDVGQHGVIENFEIGLGHIPEFDAYEEWLDANRESDPKEIFTDSYHHTGDILADYSGHHSSEIVGRMVFAHQVVALEAYLSDTFIKLIMSDPGAKQKLLATDPELKKAKFTLAEIHADPDFVDKKIRLHLRGLMYHNLSKIELLFRSTLGVEIFSPTSNRDDIFRAIEYRHDCVHRNGFDKDGNKLEVFSREYVQGIADELKNMVDHIEQQLLFL